MPSHYGDYRTGIRETLAAQRRRASLTGRPLAPQERAAIAGGVLQPYVQQYAQDYMRGQELQQRQRQWEDVYDLRKKALKQEKEAAEIAGYAQLAQLGIAAGWLGNRYYQNYQAGRPTPAQPTTAEYAGALEPINYPRIESYGPYGAAQDPSMFTGEYDPLVEFGMHGPATSGTPGQVRRTAQWETWGY